ncbi:hypothetical protein H4219_001032 [Mycoemilia scoparia]|uniref:Uncharacterized protein n=1 Tax=Mycoemilia scoparia TaxID=417184 RepID=A0A9W8AAF6_9FUNG|nr:hypothetical protein H4219_001032 [Mycoemilia scoparia]
MLIAKGIRYPVSIKAGKLKLRLTTPHLTSSNYHIPLIGYPDLEIGKQDWINLEKALLHHQDTIPPLILGNSDKLAAMILACMKPKVRGPNYRPLFKIWADKLTTLKSTLIPSYTERTLHLSFNPPCSNGLSLFFEDNSPTTGSKTLAFTDWPSSTSIRKFFTGIDTLPKPPTVQLLPQLSRSNPTKSVWSQCHALNVHPQARASLFRMLHGKIPPTLSLSSSCLCSDHQSADHLLNHCPLNQEFRSILLSTWSTLIRASYPICLQEVRKAIKSNDFPKAKTPQLSTISPTNSTFWRIAPLLRWSALPASDSPTASALHKLWQLSSSSLIHAIWMSRNEYAYGSGSWSLSKLITVHNNLVIKYAASIVKDPTIRQSIVPRILLPIPPDPPSTRDDNSPRSSHTP